MNQADFNRVVSTGKNDTTTSDSESQDELDLHQERLNNFNKAIEEHDQISIDRVSNLNNISKIVGRLMKKGNRDVATQVNLFSDESACSRSIQDAESANSPGIESRLHAAKTQTGPNSSLVVLSKQTKKRQSQDFENLEAENATDEGSSQVRIGGNQIHTAEGQRNTAELNSLFANGHMLQNMPIDN